MLATFRPRETEPVGDSLAQRAERLFQREQGTEAGLTREELTGDRARVLDVVDRAGRDAHEAEAEESREQRARDGLGQRQRLAAGLFDRDAQRHFAGAG